MITPEIFQQQAKELAAIDTMQFAMPPDGGYMLAAVVQAAVICLDLPETTQTFCKQFVNGFCDRYREQMPSVVKEIEDAWQKPNLMTEDEFEQTLGEKWQRIAQDVEREMKGEVKIILDIPKGDFSPPHHGALCPINGKPCSKEGEFYYYPDDCPDWGVCEQIANEDDDLEDRCASGFTN
ncbi:hypothetical protein [Pseudanabaena sp. 'Roaring Creek']|uniref:hypothetical protein n=1 Tax=Pseudanabaena sp. 'Roaring Creek' TaxID=1681830 RepID=UPI0006D80F16|nr:hypothetical protein [Pseudanabaena sp. 'Roaring Creek']